MDLIDLAISLLTLVVLEVILGIDNLVFLSILTEKLPAIDRARARSIGLMFAWVTRLCLLGSAVWIAGLTAPLLRIGKHAFSTRDIFLCVGGMFLMVKATQEIHDAMITSSAKCFKGSRRFTRVVLQIGLMDIIFSLDSVLTAVGLTNNFWVMASAISVAILVMLYASKPVSSFISAHPSIKMLALGFLILVGMVLIADGFSFHIPRGYVYFAVAFSLGVEALNLMRERKKC